MGLAALGGAALFGGDDPALSSSPGISIGPPNVGVVPGGGQGADQNGAGQGADQGEGHDGAGQGAGQGEDQGAGQGAAGDEAVLVGVWRAEVPDITGAPSVIETVLMENGTFSQTQQNAGGLLYNAGTWRIVEPGMLRFAIEEYYPTEFCGPQGCTNILKPPDVTAYYRVLGPDTMEVRDLAGAVVIHQRVTVPG